MRDTQHCEDRSPSLGVYVNACQSETNKTYCQDSCTHCTGGRWKKKTKNPYSLFSVYFVHRKLNILHQMEFKNNIFYFKNTAGWCHRWSDNNETRLFCLFFLGQFIVLINLPYAIELDTMFTIWRRRRCLCKYWIQWVKTDWLANSFLLFFMFLHKYCGTNSNK